MHKKRCGRRGVLWPWDSPLLLPPEPTLHPSDLSAADAWNSEIPILFVWICLDDMTCGWHEHHEIYEMPSLKYLVIHFHERWTRWTLHEDHPNQFLTTPHLSKNFFLASFFSCISAGETWSRCWSLRKFRKFPFSTPALGGAGNPDLGFNGSTHPKASC